MNVLNKILKNLEKIFRKILQKIYFGNKENSAEMGGAVLTAVLSTILILRKWTNFLDKNLRRRQSGIHGSQGSKKSAHFLRSCQRFRNV